MPIGRLPAVACLKRCEVGQPLLKLHHSSVLTSNLETRLLRSHHSQTDPGEL